MTIKICLFAVGGKVALSHRKYFIIVRYFLYKTLLQFSVAKESDFFYWFIAKGHVIILLIVHHCSLLFSAVTELIKCYHRPPLQQNVLYVFVLYLFEFTASLCLQLQTIN